MIFILQSIEIIAYWNVVYKPQNSNLWKKNIYLQMKTGL